LFIFRNSPSGKQYIDNAKHKLIMKIPLESVDLATGYLLSENKTK
jgi:formate dehydrogenase assembly factor FdhD